MFGSCGKTRESISRSFGTQIQLAKSTPDWWQQHTKLIHNNLVIEALSPSVDCPPPPMRHGFPLIVLQLSVLWFLSLFVKRRWLIQGKKAMLNQGMSICGSSIHRSLRLIFIEGRQLWKRKEKKQQEINFRQQYCYRWFRVYVQAPSTNTYNWQSYADCQNPLISLHTSTSL